MTDPLKKIELFKVCLLATFVSEDKILFFYNLNLTITVYKELGPSCIGLVRPYLVFVGFYSALITEMNIK